MKIALNIAGFQKLTLIDYPGKLATTVFTIGCTFRCPFCHNPELVVCDNLQLGGGNKVEKEFFKFLKTRHGKLEGVCITGGEPTIQPDIIEFIKKVKKLSYAVKLDTNGTRPDVLRKIIQGKLVDFIAMDIKNHLGKYNKTTNTRFDLERIRLSVDVIKNSGINYEFRTTVVPGMHVESDFIKIARWLEGSRSYWLQRFRRSKHIDPKIAEKTKGKELDLEKIMEKIRPSFKKTGIRN